MPVSVQSQSWAQSLPRITSRFPHLHPRQSASLQHDRDAFVAHIAKTHHLTLTEAREEIEDFLYLEGLRREIET